GAWICDQVEYKTNEALYDLDAATGYEVRVRGICSEEDTTDWVSVSFTTECDFDTIPYRQNFDTYTSNQLPACWNALGAGSSNYPSVYQEANSSHYVSAYSSLTMKDSYVGATFAVLPAFESYLPELQISFMAKTTDTTSGTLTVGVMTDPIDSTTFAAVSAIIPAQNDQWAKYTVRFDEYMDGGEYIAFKWENGDGNTFYIDDIMVDTIPSCYAPVSLTLEQIGKTNATLSWTDTEGGSWEIAYGTAGFNLASEGTIIATSSNPHTLTTLESNTHYDFYLRRVCDEGDFSEWTDAVSGKTAQIPASIPYAFDFETSSENRNWTMVNSNRNKWVIDTATNNTFGGSQSLYVSADSGATHSYANYFATSIWAYRDFCFPSGPHEDYMLTFDWKGKGQSNLDYLSVYIGAPAPVTAGSNSAPANAFCLFSKLNLNDAWRSDSISLNGHITSDTCRLYFLWTNDGSNGEQPPAAIDNISIRYSPCLAPTDIVIDSIDTESAKISWDAENGIEWVVRYKSEDDDEYQIDTVMTNSYDFTELTSSTHYLVEIFSICGEKRISAAIDTSFTTDEFIPDPVYYTITATADAGGTITPSGEIRILEGTDTTFHILPNEEYVIQSVLVNEVNVGNVTSYTFRNVQGDSSIRVIFQVGINEVEIENNIILYPNPARNVLTIKTDREFDNYTILNDLGQIIRTENISGNSFLIHVEELRNGIYFILFRGDGVMATKKFIKE
ncbi:choice-of-anchor J domain-containing protein, partial [Bacteroidales bacterium OttesenSCG-928-E04]|nr:choice-of-anchor J domain-containing protein [Bacteroidales bacterium OttesenSCG-928-E04]